MGDAITLVVGLTVIGLIIYIGVKGFKCWFH